MPHYFRGKMHDTLEAYHAAIAHGWCKEQGIKSYSARNAEWQAAHCYVIWASELRDIKGFSLAKLIIAFKRLRLSGSLRS